MTETYGKDPVAYSNAKQIYDDHMDDAMDIRNFIEGEIQRSKLRLTQSDTLIIVMDHFGIHYIPAYKQSLAEFKCMDGHGVLGVSFSGITDPVRDRHEYVLYCEPYSEDSNINCFHLDSYLCNYLARHRVQKIILASDTSAKLR